MAVLSSRAQERRSHEKFAREARENERRSREKNKNQVASAPISSRFLCPRPPLLLGAPNQNRHATQANPYRDLIMLGDFQIGNLQLQKSVFSEYT